MRPRTPGAIQFSLPLFLSPLFFYQEEYTVRQTNKRVGLFLIVGLGLMSAVALAQSEKVKQDIESRLEPAGELCMAGEDCAAAGAATASSDEPRSGEAIYQSACTTCHANGVSGAPILGNADDWAAPIDKGMDTLYEHALNGFNAMPAMGLCSDCSDDEIKATVDYMVESSQ